MRRLGLGRRIGARARPAPLLAGALAACLALLGSCGTVERRAEQVVTGVRPLSPAQDREALAAWRYFRNGRVGGVGLVEAVAGGGFSTPSSMGDTLFAAVAARRLGVIEQQEFDAAVSGVVQFLSSMDLSRGGLPARVYDGRTGQFLTFPSDVTDPGYSAVELGRLLGGLAALVEAYPGYRIYVGNALSRWNACAARDATGVLLRSTREGGGFVTQPDFGSGYYDYAAQAFRLWGVRAPSRAAAADDASLTTFGISFSIPLDPNHDEPLFITPYALLGVETGFKAPDGQPLSLEAERARAALEAQRRRSAETGVLTARSDFRRTTAPYEVVDTVISAGYPWSTTDRGGAVHADLALVSTRASLLSELLWPSAYTHRAADQVRRLYDADLGWYEGRYELTGGHEVARTSATNAAVLEALLYRNGGRILSGRELQVPAPPSRPGAADDPKCLLPALHRPTQVAAGS